MKPWQKARRHHHHQRLTALLVQYAHLDLEQKLEAFKLDVTALANTIPPHEGAVRILEEIADSLRGHR